MTVWVRSQGLRRRSVRLGTIAASAEAMLSSLGRPTAELSILLCDDETIRELNRTYRKKDRPTDVLAFAMREGPGPVVQPEVLGDVVISLPTARRQAAERDRPIVEEVVFLLAHGLLHLLGYDHRNAREEAEMNARTRDLVGAARAARGLG